MNPLVAAVLIALASYRVWRFAAKDMFPPMVKAREWFEGKLGHEHWAVELWFCPWCLGTYVTAAVTWAADASVGFAAPVLVGVAASTLVGLVAAYDVED